MIDQAEIHQKANSNRLEDLQEASKLFTYFFPKLPDKVEAWKDLIKLSQDKTRDMRCRAAKALGSAFSHVPDKARAWQDLVWMAQNQYSYGDVRGIAVDTLRTAFDQVPDKDQAWQDLHDLTQNQNIYRLLKAEELELDNDYVQGKAAMVLGSVFDRIPDKDQAWQDLHRLTQEYNSYVRMNAAEALESVFSHIPDKAQAWQDLVKLTQDDDDDVRCRAAEALGSAFSHVPDKARAWEDLVWMARNQHSYVDMRWFAADTLITVFDQVPDKDQAWQDLHDLTQEYNSYVRMKAAVVLGSVFDRIPDKDLAWQDLVKLTQDDDGNVRMYAYHALGKASVFKATTVDANDEMTLKSELKNAIGYFERSSQESNYSPARFCHPFYRTYYAIAFQEAKNDEVQKYLSEAKNAVEGSECKDKLFKAIENLAGALQEAHRLKDRPLWEVLRDLKSFEWYCTQAEIYMDSAEEKAPGAVRLLRRGNPRIKQRIEAIIEEIQDCARLICKESHDKGLETRNFCDPIREAAISLSSEDLTETLNTINEFVSLLKEKSQLLPDGDRELVQKQLDDVDRTGPIPEKLNGIKVVVTFFLSRIQRDDEFIRRLEAMDAKVGIIRTDLASLRDSILSRFDSNERNMLSAIFKRLDEDNLKIINAILDAVNKESIPNELVIETLNASRDLIAEIKATQIKIQDPETAKSLNDWDDAINSPELGIENKIKVTIPIIPHLLTYEGSYKFQTGMKLDSAWNKLCALVQR